MGLNVNTVLVQSKNMRETNRSCMLIKLEELSYDDSNLGFSASSIK